MQQDIYDVYSLAGQCEAINRRMNNLVQEKTQPAPPVYKTLPTNNYDTLKKQYTDEWVSKHSSIKFFKILFLMLNAFAIIAIAILFIADVFGNTGYILTPEKVKEFGDTNQLIAVCIGHVLFSLALIIITFVTVGEES